MKWQVDYDQVAPTYDKRYARNPYTGVEKALLQFAGNEPGLQILEVGCGTGHWLEVLHAHHLSVTGLDFSAGMLAKARSQRTDVELIRGRAEQLSLQTAALDRLFCINAIHHFVDKPAFLAEAYRVLRPGGNLLSVGLDPHTGLDQWYVYDYFPESLEIDRQRYPSAKRLLRWMQEAGFEHCITYEVEHWAIQLPTREIFEQGRLEKAATSQLSVLTDTEYQQGIHRIREDMQRAEKEGQTPLLITDLRLYETTGSAAG